MPATLTFALEEGPLLAATHVAVRRQGAEIVSTFVFDDGLIQEPVGIAVVFTDGAASSMAALFNGLVADSPDLQRLGEAPRDRLEPPPRPYVTMMAPVRAAFVTAVVMEGHGCVYAAFINVDPLRHRAGGSSDPLLCPRVSMASPVFVAWVDEIVSRWKEKVGDE